MAPLRHMTSGQVNGVTLAPESLLVFGERSEVAGAVREPLRCGILSIKPQALQSAAHRLGVDIELPGPGEFRAIASLDQVHLGEFSITCCSPIREGGDVPEAIGDEFAGAVTESLAGDAERGSRTGSRIDYVHVVRVCEEYSTAPLVSECQPRRSLRRDGRFGASHSPRLLRDVRDVADWLPARRRAQRGPSRVAQRYRIHATPSAGPHRIMGSGT